jgi:Pyridoxamine 5'-phosphate oxidase
LVETAAKAVPWAAFARAAPELAERGAAMLRAFTLAYLATLRRDGSPRVHPVTVTVDGTGVYVYAVASTPKARDLRRDSRYAAHAFPTFVESDFRDDEFAFGGRAVEMTDRALYDDVATRHNDTVHEGDPMFRLDLSWALHKRREPGRGAVYLRWRLGSGSGDAVTMAGP